MSAGEGRLARVARRYACQRCGGSGIEPVEPLPGDQTSRERLDAFYPAPDDLAARHEATLETFAPHYGSPTGEPDGR